MKHLSALILFCASVTSLAAHPHVFIDTGIDLVVDAQGQLTHLRVTWEYDALYSLLITEDMGLDPDGDGTLTKAEIDRLNGFDMQWVDEFNGDLLASSGGRQIALSGPKDVITRFEDARIVTSHLRALETPAPAGSPVTISPFDPTYYTAYEVSRPVTAPEGSDCDITRQMPDMTGATAKLQQQLAALAPNEDPADVGLPEIGAELATNVIVTCARP